jgi:hypothetical protein
MPIQTPSLFETLVSEDFGEMGEATHPPFLATSAVAIILLGIVAAPYIQSGSPILRIIAIGFALFVVLGALLIYILRISVPTYLFGAGCVIIATVAMRYLFEYWDVIWPYLLPSAALAVGFIIPNIPLPPAWKPLQELLGAAMPILLVGVLVFAVVRGIQALASLSSMAAGPSGPVRKEHFQGVDRVVTGTGVAGVVTGTGVAGDVTGTGVDGVVARDEGEKETAASMTRRVRAAIDRVQDMLDLLTDYGESTCAIVRDVEAGYIGARSAPEDEQEYSLPQEVQGSRKEQRQTRARKAFATNMSLFASIRSSKPLECFVGEGSEEDEEDDLREALQELQALLDNEAVLMSVNKADQVAVALAFSNKILDKSEKEGFQTSAPSSSLSFEGLRGEELLRAGRSLLARERALTAKITALERDIATTQARVNAQYRRAASAMTMLGK